MADTGCEKGEGALTNNFQINGFWPEFYIKKMKFVEKREGRAPPHLPLNPPLRGFKYIQSWVCSIAACGWAFRLEFPPIWQDVSKSDPHDPHYLIGHLCLVSGKPSSAGQGHAGYLGALLPRTSGSSAFWEEAAVPT